MIGRAAPIPPLSRQRDPYGLAEARADSIISEIVG